MSAYNRPAYYGADSANEGLDFYKRIGLGLEKENGYFSSVILGKRIAVNSGDIIKNWATGGTYLYPDDAGEAMELVATGPLVTDILISGLGPDLALQDSVVVTTNGTTPVPIPGLWSRILGMRNVGAVSADVSVIVRAAGASVEPYCELDPLTQRAFTGMYSVPAGYSGQIITVIGSMEKTSGNDAGATFRLSQKQQGGIEVTDFGFGIQRSGTTSVTFDSVIPFGIPEKSDIVVRGDVSTDGTIDLLLWMSILLSKNSVTGIE